MKLIFQISLVSLLLLTAATPCFADIIYVRSDGFSSGNGFNWFFAYNTINAAVDAAQPGDEIWVKEGVYKPSPNGTIDDAIKIQTSNISLYGGFAGNETFLSQRNAGDHPTIITGDLEGPGSSSDNSNILISLTSVNNVLIDGFTIKDAFTNPDAFQTEHGAISVESSILNIRSCIFQDNVAYINPCISSVNSTVNVESCLFYENVSGTGILLQIIEGVSFISMVNVSIIDNGSFNYLFGIQQGSTLQFYNSIVDESPNSDFNNGGGNVFVSNCLLTNDNGASSLIDVGFFDPLFFDPADGNFNFSASSPAYDQGIDSYPNHDRDVYGNSRFFDTSVDIGCIESNSCFQSNDACVSAVPLEFGADPTWGSTRCATITLGESASCTPGDGLSVWYKFTAPTAGSVRVSTLFQTGYNGQFDIRHSLFTGTCSNLTEVACEDNTSSSDEVNDFDNLIPGEEYFLKIDAPFPQTGGFTIALENIAPAVITGAVYVDKDAQGNNDGSDWFNAYTDLVDALEAFTFGDIILIAEGVYSHESHPDRIFNLPDGVFMIGGYNGTETAIGEVRWDLNETVLQANQENSSGIISMEPPEIGVSIYGLVLEGARINGGNTDGAVTIKGDINDPVDRVDLVVSHCIFRNNESPLPGGGGPVINSFDLNASQVDVMISNCLVHSNFAVDRLIKIFSETVNINVYNSTFTQNTLSTNGILIGGSPDSDIQNNVFWNNQGNREVESQMSVSHCIVENIVPSTGDANINADPLFVDASNFNFNLSEGSPAIGMGNSAAPNTEVDLSFNARIQMGALDAGCYESPFATPVLCPADINGDGQVNTADLTALLAEYGCSSNCSVDLNGDATVNTGDLTALLAVLGSSCD